MGGNSGAPHLGPTTHQALWGDRWTYGGQKRPDLDLTLARPYCELQSLSLWRHEGQGAGWRGGCLFGTLAAPERLPAVARSCGTCRESVSKDGSEVHGVCSAFGGVFALETLAQGRVWSVTTVHPPSGTTTWPPQASTRAKRGQNNGIVRMWAESPLGGGVELSSRPCWVRGAASRPFAVLSEVRACKLRFQF